MRQTIIIIIIIIIIMIIIIIIIIEYRDDRKQDKEKLRLTPGVQETVIWSTFLSHLTSLPVPPCRCHSRAISQNHYQIPPH